MIGRATINHGYCLVAHVNNSCFSVDVATILFQKASVDCVVGCDR